VALVGTGSYVSCHEPLHVVARTQIGADIVISTVFVGLEFGCDPGRPRVFETEVTEARVASVDARRERYPTWAEAERGHAKIVDEYRGT
jgi:hypothetical protein